MCSCHQRDQLVFYPLLGYHYKYSFSILTLMAHKDFVHLCIHSDYSILRSTLKVQDIVDLAAHDNMLAVSLVDFNSLSGSLEFAMLAVKNGIKPIVGVDICISCNNFVHSIQLLALNNQGFIELGTITAHLFNTADTYEIEKLENYKNLICITNSSVYKDTKAIDYLYRIFEDRLYIGICRHGLNEEYASEDALIEIAYSYGIPIVATHKVLFRDSNQHKAYKVLRCIANTEDNDVDQTTECFFKNTSEMHALFANLPEAIENTLVIAKRCTVILEKQQPILPLFSDQDATHEISTQANEGLKDKFADQEIPSQYQERLDYELQVITSMNYSGYFLIVSDFIKWSKTNNIPVGPGRGSGVGSLTAWCLEITDLDPIKYDLIFERFLNPQRISMPDFDIDFCQDKRPLVIEYIRKKYGHIAHIITFGKLQARAVIKDVARVLKKPYAVAERISRMIPHDPINPVTLQQAIDNNPELQQYYNDDLTSEMMKIAIELEGTLRHVSVHAAGIVISSTPLLQQLPIYYDNDLPHPVTQYSMKYVELSGLVKFDFLGLKTLTIIDNIIKNIDLGFDILHLPVNDDNTYRLLAEGRSVGVFQLESAFMYDTLKKATPDCLEDIIALISLNRPGPMENIPSYINRKHKREEIVYLHEWLAPILDKTFGVIIYQEQVMEIAKKLSGYSMSDADLLRRAMGKKIKSEMDEQQSKFISGAEINGINKEIAENIFNLIAKFAGYGFNKSHAAAYALISYQTAYLKANYTTEFLVENMNIDIQDSDKIFLFCSEAKMFGIEVLPPDINFSKPYFTVENGKIRFGLHAVKGIGLKTAEFISQFKYDSIFSLVSKIDGKLLNKKALSGLIKSGACNSLESNQNKLLCSVEAMLQYSQVYQASQLNLFTQQKTFQFSDHIAPTQEEKNMFEYEALGFYYFHHPLNIYNEHFIFEKTVTPVILLNYVLKSKNNEKFVFLKLNSLHDTYTLPLYGSKKVNKYQPLFEKNKRLLMVTDLEKKRLLSIHHLDNYILGQNRHVLELEIDNPGAMTKIKPCLQPGALHKVKIIKKYSDKQLEIALPGKYQIALDKLLYITGVKVVHNRIKGTALGIKH